MACMSLNVTRNPPHVNYMYMAANCLLSLSTGSTSVERNLCRKTKKYSSGSKDWALVVLKNAYRLQFTRDRYSIIIIVHWLCNPWYRRDPSQVHQSKKTESRYFISPFHS